MRLVLFVLPLGAGSKLGEADRRRRPEGGLDAAAASWTIGSEEDGPALHLVSVRLRHLDVRASRCVARRAPLAGLSRQNPGR
jgi:hypothetical protein